MILKLYPVILSSLILITSPAHADSPADRVHCTPGKPNHCTVSIEIGQIAPMSGELMTKEMAASLGLKLEFKTKELQLELEKTKLMLGIEIQKEKDLRISSEKFCEEQKDILKKQIGRPWFEHPVFVAIVTTAAVIGTGYVFSQFK